MFPELFDVLGLQPIDTGYPAVSRLNLLQEMVKLGVNSLCIAMRRSLNKDSHHPRS
jgi:hypothetical protein